MPTLIANVPAIGPLQPLHADTKELGCEGAQVGAQGGCCQCATSLRPTWTVGTPPS